SEAQDAGRDFHVPIRLFLRIGTRSISPKKSEHPCFAVYTRPFIPGLKAEVFRPTWDKQVSLDCACPLFIEQFGRRSIALVRPVQAVSPNANRPDFRS
ncbi:hypothetical protein, partial [Paraburkholderia hospita]|uniref:hypothetical protein n=1 Tax=Paraburkholderia hospita TaxID=169430 RepID=UPI001A99F440